MRIIERFLTKNDCYVANVNRVDSRYVQFQDHGADGPMLHSVGCAQPSAEVFADRWDKPGVEKCVHAFIDANTGDVLQTLPWNYRGWHCGGSGNNTMIGVEMCESAYITYISATSFTVKDLAKAQADCKRAYDSAVELFAKLCKENKWNPQSICSHHEGWERGIASNHGDPENYWKGLGMSYTMDGFRRDVKTRMEQNGGYLGFPDVSEDDWYSGALTWAVEKNIVYLSGKPFYPDNPVDKATMMVYLRRLYNTIEIEKEKGGG